MAKSCCDTSLNNLAGAAASGLQIAIVGNPNCGKTTLFNKLTGARQRTGNWPGVTVDRKTGVFEDANGRIEITDLPGVYTLRPPDGLHDQALDEKLARDAIVREDFDLIVNIVDAGNLERNLYLTAQLLETARPVVVALNMLDSAQRAGVQIDIAALSMKLGVPVVPLVASRGAGIADLVTTIRRTSQQARADDCGPGAQIIYPPVVAQAAAKLEKAVAPVARSNRINARWLAVRALEGDDLALSLAGVGVSRLIEGKVRKSAGEQFADLDMLIAQARYDFAHKAAQAAVQKVEKTGATITDLLDRLALNSVLGPVIFLTAIYLMFLATINVGGAFIDFFDIAAEAIFVDTTRAILSKLGLAQWIVVAIADGLGGGIQVVATFIPIIAILFVILSFLEDSGYMVRAAFLMDRLMRKIGLPGKAFVPLIVGFGCNVPSIMAARTLENPRDRILTVLMAPFMSCGARLTVYALFAASFFSSGGQNVVFALYLVGIGAAIATGFVMKKTLLQGETVPFVMELPPYRWPNVTNMTLHAWGRLKGFIVEAGQIIVVVVMVLSILGSLGTDGSFHNQNSHNSVLSAIGRSIVPAFRPLGLSDDNWPAAVGIFTGIFAKEAVVGTLNALYSDIDDANNRSAPAPVETLTGKLSRALATIPANFGTLAASLGDPLGLRAAHGDAKTVMADQGVNNATFAAMAKRFDGKTGAFAYLLFILLYFPCIAAFGAMVREIGMRWALFAGGWSTWLAYFCAVTFYQLASFARHPLVSALWVCVLMSAMAGFIWFLYRQRQHGVAGSATV